MRFLHVKYKPVIDCVVQSGLRTALTAMKNGLSNAGATFIDEAVVVDGKIATF
jgi:hypothetical protein